MQAPADTPGPGRMVNRRRLLAYGGSAGAGAVVGAALGADRTPRPASGDRTEEYVHVTDHGATADGSTDDTRAIRAALAAAGEIWSVPDAYDGVTARPRRQAVAFPPGVYVLTDTVTIPSGVDVLIGPGAVLRAGAAMGPLLDTAVDELAQDQFIDCQGVLDCNDLATVGVYLRSFAAYRLRTPHVQSPVQYGIVLGDPASARRSYEGHVSEAFVWRPNGRAVPPDSIGIWLRNAGDCTVLSGTVNGCDIGVSTETGGNSLIAVHAWNHGVVDGQVRTGNNMVACFRESDGAYGNAYIGCIADTPRGTGFSMGGHGARLIAPKVYNSPHTGTDGEANGVDVATPGAVSLVEGLHCQGGDARHRLAADVVGDRSQTTIIGTVATHTSALAPTAVLGLALETPPDLYDRFLGTDGALPSADRWTALVGSGAGATVGIDGNRLLLASGTTGDPSEDRVAVVSTLPPIRDVQVTVQVELGDRGSESHFRLVVRGSAPDVPTGKGHALEVSAARGVVALLRSTEGTWTKVDSRSDLPLEPGSRWWFRLRTQGRQVAWGCWPDGAGEQPGSTVTSDDGDDSIGSGLVSVVVPGGDAPGGSRVHLRRVTVHAL